jgi:hypothetical protein
MSNLWLLRLKHKKFEQIDRFVDLSENKWHNLYKGYLNA